MSPISRKLSLAAACLALVGSLSYGVTILSVAGSNGSQVLGGTITPGTLANLYADLASIGTVVGGATGAPTGTGAMVLQTSPTLITPALGVATATSINGNTITTGTGTLTLGSGVITMPNATVSMIGTGAQACGATATCSATAATSQKVVTGSGTLVSGTPSTFALTGMSPAFTSSSTYLCNAVDTTTVATSIGVLTAGYVSGSAVTFTGPNTNTDTFRYSCVGN